MTNGATQPIRVLHLEADPEVCRRARAVLEADGLKCTLQRVDSEADYRGALESGQAELILADLELSATTGVGALAIRERLAPTTPFILVADSRGEVAALDALKHGATDVVL